MQTPAAQTANPAIAIAAIEAMDLGELRHTWSAHFGNPPPLRSPELLGILLGWRLQAKAHGGISRGLRRKLRLKGAAQSEGLDLGVGATISRTWQGKLYEITVEEVGFRWDGTLYPSLSALARTITGTRWNGPRFFGLREKK